MYKKKFKFNKYIAIVFGIPKISVTIILFIFKNLVPFAKFRTVFLNFFEDVDNSVPESSI